jgi:hypothetical protein
MMWAVHHIVVDDGNRYSDDDHDDDDANCYKDKHRGNNHWKGGGIGSAENRAGRGGSGSGSGNGGGRQQSTKSSKNGSGSNCGGQEAPDKRRKVVAVAGAVAGAASRLM